jgi:hypothetical protein
MRGTFTISFVVHTSKKTKKVTLLREYYIDEQQAAESKANFIELNNEFIETDTLEYMWQPMCKYL